MTPSCCLLIDLFRIHATLETRFTASLGAVHGLALTETLALLRLAENPAGRMRRVDLAQALALSQSSITRLALPLEKRGLLDRDTDDNDGRVVYVVLTTAGRALARDAESTFARIADDVFGTHWTAGDVGLCLEFLQRLAPDAAARPRKPQGGRSP